MHISTQTYLSPYGEITLGSFDTRLCLCNWSDKKNKTAVENRLKKYLEVNNFIQSSNALLTTAAEQLDAYFKSKLTHFDLPLILAGSDFQKQVWRTLQTIPYGHTTSYLELAQRIGKDKAVRAVANANAANALSIIVPCHRIIGSDGKLTGYAGGFSTKQALLDLEQS